MSSSGSRPRDQERPQQKGRSSALAEASLSIFRQFCMSSTLHGTYFWAEARTVLGKALWVVVVGIGEIWPGVVAIPTTNGGMQNGSSDGI